MANIHETDLQPDTDILKVPWMVGNPPPAFDLFLERERILRDGEAAKPSFFENAHAYIKEHLTWISNVEFAPYIINENTSGLVTLTTPGYEGSVSELYNPSRADWPHYRNGQIQRKRAETEYLAFSTFEKSGELENAQAGDKFIWFSPPPIEYLNTREIKKLEALGYGYHSFAFVYEVKYDHQANKRYIESRAIRHYLNPSIQAELVNSLAQEYILQSNSNLTDIDLLRQIVKVKRFGVTVDSLVEEINNLYQNTPLAERIEPPSFLNKFSEEEAEKIIQTVNQWLEGVFYLNLYDTSRREDTTIERQFRGWENAVRDLLEGKRVNISTEDIGDPRMWALIRLRGAVTDRRGSSVLGGFIDREYAPVAGGCGVGAGFGSKSERKTTYSSTENANKTFTGKCPVCGKHVEDLHVGDRCPGCKTEYLCA